MSHSEKVAGNTVENGSEERETETAAERFARLFQQYNDVANTELEQEKHRVINEFVEAQGRGAYHDAFSPGVAKHIRNFPDPVQNGVTSGVFANSSIPKSLGSSRSTLQRSIWGGVLAAAYQLIVGLPKVIDAPPAERATKLTALALEIGSAALTAGLTVYMAKKLEAFLVRNVSRILETICDKKASEAFVFKAVGNCLHVPAVCGVMVAGAVTAFKALFFAAKAAWARYNGDSLSSDEAKEAMWAALGIDNCVRTVVSTVGAYLAALVAPVLGTGFFSFLIPVALLFLSEWVVELAIASKNWYGGSWSMWCASWFMKYRGRKVWRGGDFAEYEGRITEGLICDISLEIVVDPIRSVRTGRLYEKAVLYGWLDKHHTDPVTNEKATRLDYFGCLVAKKHAEVIASHLHANAVPAAPL